MANMDFRLGEWFKQVEKREQELKAKKSESDIKQPAQPEAVKSEPVINTVKIQEPAAQAQPEVISNVITKEVVANVDSIDLSKPPVAGIENSNPKDFVSDSSLFDDEVPQVEDFLSFIGETSEKQSVLDDEDDPIDIPMGRRPLSTGTLGPLSILSEGTGEPRPISKQIEQNNKQVVKPAVESKTEVSPINDVEQKPAPAVKNELAANKVEKLAAQPNNLEENWAQMPAHLKILFGSSATEIAQNSYTKAFKESRGEMIQRLLDPQLTLEEAARILNVCPTTVRRYTNRGVLKHLRTAGNQRRFRLSDVLAFMESSTAKGSVKSN